jgi:uncharacterized protein (TIGR02996 family)
MSDLQRLMLGLASDPGDDTGWLALADCLEEAGQPLRAELLRLQLWLRSRLDDPAWPAWEQRLHELWAADVPGCQPARSGPLGVEFVLVPPGEFWMGARDGEQWANDNEHPRHRVRLTRGFWMARTPVTRGQWDRLMEAHRKDGEEALPVDRATYTLAAEFCSLYGGLVGAACRLPDEAEWEYACRAGTASSFCSGEGVEALRRVGWCSYDGKWDSSGGVRPVGQLAPNSWGLFDMHGNVWEWCNDWFGDYSEGAVTAPRVEAGVRQRVIRGGSWRGGPWFCRSAERWSLSPDVEMSNNGFRLVLELS